MPIVEGMRHYVLFHIQTQLHHLAYSVIVYCPQVLVHVGCQLIQQGLIYLYIQNHCYRLQQSKTFYLLFPGLFPVMQRTVFHFIKKSTNVQRHAQHTQDQNNLEQFIHACHA